MAKKSVPSIEDAIKSFKEVMQRASLSNYYYVGNVLISKNTNGNNILIVPDQALWNNLIENKELKDEYNLKEPDLTNCEESTIPSWVEYVADLKTDWFPIDMDADLYTGKVFKIKINNYEYKISINRDLMPMKLKKAEYENISYKVFNGTLKILAIKKRFENVVEGYGFTIVRLFQII
jgi:hypothetical protein